MMFLDKNGVLDGCDEINVYIYPYKLVSVEENVIFRAYYEHIKHKCEDRYIFALKMKDYLRNSKTLLREQMVEE